MATQIKDTIIETFKLDRENVDKVIANIEKLIHEGSVRRVVVKDARGVTIIEVPLTLGLVGVALVPVWAAIAAIAAIAADFEIQVERKDPAAS
jgi:Flp pilus assembly pilin Flp